MNKLLRTGIGAVIIITVISGLNFFLPGSASVTQSTDQASASGGQIYEATVLIKMLLPMSEKARKDAEVLETGMGTLIAIDGGNYLVTHNHWGTVLQELTKVELYDSNYRLIKLMFGYEFIDLVRYQDEGTLILKSPLELDTRLTPAALGDPGDIQPGEVVRISYRQAPSRDKAGVLEARVEEVFERGGVPAYRLRCLNGGVIQRGDSGGGIWHDGKYVGNMWITIVAVPAVDNPAVSESQPTDTSYAALYPTNLSFQEGSGGAYGNQPAPTIQDDLNPTSPANRE